MLMFSLEEPLLHWVLTSTLKIFKHELKPTLVTSQMPRERSGNTLTNIWDNKHVNLNSQHEEMLEMLEHPGEGKVSELPAL